MFYRLLNSRLSGRTTIGALTTSDGNIVRSDKDKVELFAQVFGGSFTDCSSLGSPRQSVTESNFSLMQDSVWFHREEILEIILKGLKSRSITPDGIPLLFIQKVAHIIAGPLEHIFNLSFMRGEVPSRWRHSFVTPIPKKTSSHIAFQLQAS